MRRYLLRVCLLLASIISVISVQSVLAMSATIDVDGKTLHLMGLGLRKQLSDDLYVGALYLEVKTRDPKIMANPSISKRMEVRILNERVSPKRFGRLWAETIRINNDADALKQHSSAIITFMNIFKGPLMAGDHLVFQHSQGQGVIVSLNTVKIGQISDDSFMPLLVQTWIGPRPPSDTFKANILGEDSSGIAALKSQFELQNPTPSRVAEIKDWKNKAAADDDDDEPPKKPARPAQRTASTQPSNSAAQRRKAEEEAYVKAAVAAALEKQKQELEEKRKKQEEKLEQQANQAQLAQELAIKDYEQSLISYVEKRVPYPPAAFKRGLEGSGIVKIQIARNGEIQQVTIDKSTNSRLLDKEALKAIQQLSPLPGMPENVPGKNFEFLAPVTFKR